MSTATAELTVPAASSRSATGAGPRATSGTTSAGHLRQVDLVRVLTFGAVIAVHAVAATFATESVSGNALLAFLHFTREGFFALSGFVLVHAARGRSVRPMTFWRRRLPLVAVPYLAWSGLYLLLHAALGTAPLPTPGQVVSALLTGNAEYHLYFLLVTLQVYLLLPALVWLLRRTRDYHALLLVGSLLLQVGTAMFLQYGSPESWPGRFYAAHGYELLPSYQFWVLLGALAAVHLDRVTAAVDRFARPLLLGGVGFLLAGQFGYLVLVHSGTLPSIVSSVFQPMLVPLFATTIALLYVVGARWATGVGDGTARTPRLVAAASQASFGIYLVHPAVLDLLASHVTRLPPALAAAVLWIAAVAVSALVVALVRRTPASLALCGRPRRARPIVAVVPAGAPA